jgi:YVTN family beta-propeller protein
MSIRTLIRACGALFIFACTGCSPKMTDNSTVNPSTVAIPPIAFDALYVVNGGSNSLTVINTTTNEVAGTIALKDASFPHHLALSPDHGSLCLAVPGMDLSGGHAGGGMAMNMKGAILKLNATTGVTEVSRMLDASNHNGAFSPDGKEIWTSQMIMMGKVLVLDAVTLKTLKTIDAGDMPAEVTFSSQWNV